MAKRERLKTFRLILILTAPFVILMACQDEGELNDPALTGADRNRASIKAIHNLLDLYEKGILNRDIDLLESLFSEDYLDAEGFPKDEKLKDWSFLLDRSPFRILNYSFSFNYPKYFHLVDRDVMLDGDTATISCRERSQWVNTFTNLRETRSKNYQISVCRERWKQGGNEEGKEEAGWRFLAIDIVGNHGLVWTGEFWYPGMIEDITNAAVFPVTVNMYNLQGSPITAPSKIPLSHGGWVDLERCMVYPIEELGAADANCGSGYCNKHLLECFTASAGLGEFFDCLDFGCFGNLVFLPDDPGLHDLSVELYGRDGSIMNISHRYRILNWNLDNWEIYPVKGANIVDNSIASMCIGPRGGIWIGTQANGRIYRYDIAGKKMELKRDLKGGPYEVLPNLYSIQAMTMDESGNLWFGVAGMRNDENVNLRKETAEIVRFDQTTWTTFEEEEFAEGQSPTVLCALADDEGGVWFGGKGVWYWDGAAFSRYYTKDDGLGAEDVNCMVLDDAGNLWCGTSIGGISRFADGEWETYTYSPYTPSRVDELQKFVYEVISAVNLMEPIAQIPDLNVMNLTDVKEDMIWSAAKDHRGHLWFGTYGGGVLVYRDGDPTDRNNWDHFTVANTAGDHSEGLLANVVMAISADPSNRIWFGTPEGISCLDEGDTREKSDDSWENYRLEEFRAWRDYKGPRLSTVTRAIAFDGEGTPWFGTLLGGLLHLKDP